jgi:hypothetical protein
MGEVYRARDARLWRDVALKILPSDVSSDPDRRARFEQEARAAAALNHPNILGIYDVGSEGAHSYIAAELVSGESLASLLEGGRQDPGLRARQAIPACAIGLERRAHRATDPGRDDRRHGELHEPEQARGKPTDHRSDQFSFGLVLYEMATGRKVFDKQESVQTMAAIISDEPPPLDSRIPAPLRWTIDRCLAKEPAGRYESTRDRFHDLRSLRDHLSEASGVIPAVAGVPTPGVRGRRWFVPAAFAAGVVSVDLATAVPRKLIATARNELMPAWAAKQPAVVYVSDRNGPNEIWLRRPDNPDRPIVTARDFREGPTQWFAAPTLSPDASRTIYTRIGVGTMPKIWISSVAGGAPIRLTNEDTAEYTGSWSPDGVWFVYCSVRNDKVDLKKVKTTGQATPIVLKRDVSDANVPSWSPDGSWIAVGSSLVSPDGQTVKSLGDHRGRHYMFSADGKFVYSIRSDQGREDLFRIDIATGTETVIGNVGREFRPGSNLTPSIRFSLAPDGKSFIFGSGTFTSNLWMLEGFAPKSGLLSRFGR